MSNEIIKQIEDGLVLYEGEGGWVEMGGKGSGNWRHRGRPGKRGGSAARGAGAMPFSGKSANIVSNEIVTAYKEGNPLLYGQWTKELDARHKSRWVLEADDLKITISGSADIIYAKTRRLRDPSKTKFTSTVDLDIRGGGKPPVFRELAYKGIKGEHNRDKVDAARAKIAKRVESVFGIPADQFKFEL